MSTVELAAAFADETRDLLGRLTPAPAVVAADHAGHADDVAARRIAPTVSTEAAATTAMTSHVENPPTAVMPPGMIPQPGAPALLGDDFVRQSRTRGRVIGWLIAGGVLLLLLLVLWNVSGDDNKLAASVSDVPTTPAVTTTVAPTSVAVSTTAAGTVLVDPNTLVGLNKKDATQRLVALGLVVKEKKASGHGNLAKDTVVAVEPSGQVPAGATITIEVAGKK